jgi:hypothetical protein
MSVIQAADPAACSRITGLRRKERRVRLHLDGASLRRRGAVFARLKAGDARMAVE